MTLPRRSRACVRLHQWFSNPGQLGHPARTRVDYHAAVVSSCGFCPLVCPFLQLSDQSANSISRGLFNPFHCWLKPADQENGMIFALSQCSTIIQLELRNTREGATCRQRCEPCSRTKEEQ